MTLKQKLVNLLTDLLKVHNIKAQGNCGALCMCHDIKAVIEYLSDKGADDVRTNS